MNIFSRILTWLTTPKPPTDVSTDLTLPGSAQAESEQAFEETLDKEAALRGDGRETRTLTKTQI